MKVLPISWSKMNKHFLANFNREILDWKKCPNLVNHCLRLDWLIQFSLSKRDQHVFFRTTSRVFSFSLNFCWFFWVFSKLVLQVANEWIACCESRAENNQSKVFWNCKNLDAVCRLSVAPGRCEVSDYNFRETLGIGIWKVSPKVINQL
jgi:hypothetical protein